MIARPDFASFDATNAFARFSPLSTSGTLKFLRSPTGYTLWYASQP
jgi:hypothetical protein